MANFLGYICPKCADTDEIEVAATVWLRLTGDGTDADASENGDHEYHPKSSAICQSCGFEGRFHEFEPEPEPLPLAEALQQALIALNTSPRFSVPTLKTNSYEIAALCGRALQAVKEG